jgi:lipoprotein NlpD
MASIWGRRTLVTVVCAASAWALFGCAASGQAPVEDRSTQKNASHPFVSPSDTSKSAAAAATPAPVVEAKPGTYIVKPGDTLIGIGLAAGQSWRDIARWNGIDNPNVIEVGQVLRTVAPVGETVTTTTTTTTTTASNAGSSLFKPLPPATTASTTAVPGAKPGSTAVASSSAPVTPLPPVASATPVPLTGAAAPPPPAAAREGDDDLTWAWPAAGPVVAGFDDAKTKGLAIGGKAGDPVFAAADGRVVYAGSGLRGYGNLVIVKHNANYLTAYAHNQTLLVKEDQVVKRGQKIAEMGSTDADRVQLHFEIRKQGKPIDPAKLLPPR